MYNLEGKVALVTGASKKNGIGRGVALRLADEGADVVVTGPPLEQRECDCWGGIDAVVEEIESKGRRGLAITADISDAEQVREMVAKSVREMGGIDILVNNAGAPAGSDRVPVVDLEENDWDLVIRVNLKGTFLCGREVARAMIERKAGGKIINMSSISGKRGKASYAAYSSSKFGIHGFTQSLAREAGCHGITVNAICAGLINTGRVSDLAEALAPPGVDSKEFAHDWLKKQAADYPLGRIGEVSDVANLAAFLASSQADWITGALITLDGGNYMG